MTEFMAKCMVPVACFVMPFATAASAACQGEYSVEQICAGVPGDCNHPSCSDDGTFCQGTYIEYRNCREFDDVRLYCEAEPECRWEDTGAEG